MARRQKPDPISYDDLYRYFAKELKKQKTSCFDVNLRRTTVVYTGCGIYLDRPPLHNGGYWCTPVNSVQFAYTGGDGCHFSFVTAGTRWSGASPVVMTYPAAGGCVHNVIVGEDLVEFLRLGIHTGYFVLEDLSRYSEEFDESHPFVVRSLESGQFNRDLSADEVSMLEQLAARFGLTPWANGGRRLAELQRQHLQQLRFSDEYYSIMGLASPSD
jgi:hypothetical protein